MTTERSNLDAQAVRELGLTTDIALRTPDSLDANDATFLRGNTEASGRRLDVDSSAPLASRLELSFSRKAS
jgi:hypothetical protein